MTDTDSEGVDKAMDAARLAIDEFYNGDTVWASHWLLTALQANEAAHADSPAASISDTPLGECLAPFSDDWLVNPDFENAGRVHDWRNHVGEHVKAIWATLSDHARRAIALDADQRADAEEWD